METTCESCEAVFEAKRSTARFCSITCRSRAARAQKASAEPTPVPPAVDDATGLVGSVRDELVKAGRDQTFYGQLALQLAGRLADRDESGISSLSKELRTVMAAALEGAAPAEPAEPTPAPAVEDDEVERARRRREESRQAAGLA